MIKQKVDISKRYHYNLEICRKLMEYFSKNQDVRFFQGLASFNLFNKQFDDRMNCSGIDDPFYEESEVTLNKLK